jgi:hypothetical protein
MNMKKYLFLLVAILLIVAGLYMYFVAGNQLRSVRGLSKGGDYISKLYSDYTVVGKSCQGEDSDADGYITCNFRLKSNQGGAEKTSILQCPTFLKSYMGTSCKESGFTINQN